MLDFKTFYNLNETVQVLKNELNFNPIVNLGFMGWWNVYCCVESQKKLENKIYFIDEYLNLVNEKIVIIEPCIRNYNSIKKQFEDSAYRLGALGFPKMRQIALLKDLSNETNHITGLKSDVGGLANIKEHGMIIDKSSVINRVIIHEHAHMYWFNLPKHNKEFFKKYYKEVVANIKSYDPETVWKLKNQNFEKPKLFFNKDNFYIDRFFDLFKIKEFSKQNIPMSVENYLELRNYINSDNEQEKIIAAVFRYNGSHCTAKLKVNLNHKFEKDQLVDVERWHNNFIINKINRKSFEDEYSKSFEKNEILNILEFDINYLNENQLEFYNDSLEIAKIDPFKIFGSSSKKEEIEKQFQSIFDNLVNRYNNEYLYRKDYKIKKFKLRNIFNTWVAIISRRFKNGNIKNIKDLEQAVLDTANKKANSYEIESNIQNHDNLKPWDKPEMSHWRQAAELSGYAPNAYGASNIDELWATSVENAALGNKINLKLKKLIYQTINGF